MDIGALPYLAGKALHAAFAAGFGVLLYPVYAAIGGNTVSAGLFSGAGGAGGMGLAVQGAKSASALFIVTIAVLTVFAFIVYSTTKTTKKHKKRAV